MEQNGTLDPNRILFGVDEPFKSTCEACLSEKRPPVCPLMHRIFVISGRSYNWISAIMSNIRRFSLHMPSLTRHSYSGSESVHILSGIVSMSQLLQVQPKRYGDGNTEIDPVNHAKNSETRMLRVTRSRFVKLQWMIFPRTRSVS